MCLQKSTCVGFNYRAAKSNNYVINCQLSNKTRGKNNIQSEETVGWNFYQDMRTTVSESRILIRLFNTVARDVPGGKHFLIMKINAQHNALSKAIKAGFRINRKYL